MQRDEVGAQLRRRREGDRLAVTGHVRVAARAVGHHLPVRGCGDGDVEGRLQVGLVELGEHPFGVGGFELRVEVNLVVDGVDEAVQTFAGVGVQACRIDDERVALL